MSEHVATRTVMVTNYEGLHLRAAAMVVETVRRYESEVNLTKNDMRVGTEVLQLVSLGAAQGEQLLIEATGHDAEQILDALVRLFAGNFEEDQPGARETES